LPDRTELKDRTLWFDGTSQVDPELVPNLLLAGVPLSHIAVTELNEDITKFNQMSEIQIPVGKEGINPPDMSYNIPEKYLNMAWDDEILEDLWNYLRKIGIAGDEVKRQVYLDRLMAEFAEIRSRNMEMIIRTLIYVEDTFRNNDIVWGVGRGSSCASLALFIIGVHKVDPIKYGIPMSEFFHD